MPPRRCSAPSSPGGGCNDRPDRSRTLGLLIGFAGVVLLASDKASFKPGGSGWAVLACLGATLCYGIAANFTKRYLSGVHPLAIATGSQIGATLVLALPTWLFWPEQNPGMTPWMSLIVLGILCTGVAYILYFRLIAQLGPARAITVTFLIPVFAVFFGATLLGEELHRMDAGMRRRDRARNGLVDRCVALTRRQDRIGPLDVQCLLSV